MSEAKYDVIVVGAGIAGLTCANYLVSAGKRVLVLEHNHQAGGLMGGSGERGSILMPETSHLKKAEWFFQF